VGERRYDDLPETRAKPGLCQPYDYFPLLLQVIPAYVEQVDHQEDKADPTAHRGSVIVVRLGEGDGGGDAGDEPGGQEGYDAIKAHECVQRVDAVRAGSGLWGSGQRGRGCAHSVLPGVEVVKVTMSMV
jgi:hypothetical protein